MRRYMAAIDVANPSIDVVLGAFTTVDLDRVTTYTHSIAGAAGKRVPTVGLGAASPTIIQHPKIYPHFYTLSTNDKSVLEMLVEIMVLFE